MASWQDMEVKNAVITRTSLGYEDHGILTCYLTLDYGGSGQSFGGHALDEPIRSKDGTFIRRRGCGYGMEYIAQILNTLEAESWEALTGTVIRVRANHSKVEAIGHVLKDRWFIPADLAKRMEGKDERRAGASD